MLKTSLAIVVMVLSLQSVVAQSGRGRPRVEPPPTKPAPEAQKPATQPTQKPTTGAPAGGAFIDQSQSGLTTRTVFRNGLTVIIAEDHSAPLVSLVAWVKAGTADDPDSARGAARVTANALLFGTTSRTGTAWRRQMDAIGARVGVDVGPTRTRLAATAPLDGVTALVELGADAVRNPTFSEEAVKAAAEAAQQDITAVGEDPAAFSAGRWLGTAYPGHPLGRGEATPENLAAVKREAVVAFHKERFTPGNTVICLSGDVIGPVVLRTVQQAFGGWAGAAPTAKLPELAQTALRYQEERGATTASWVHLGYTLPSAVTAEDRVVWDVLHGVLALGRGGRLVQNLRDTRGIVTDIRSELVIHRNLAAFVIGLRVAPESLDRAEALTIEIVERLRRERISEGEMQRVKSLLEKEFITRSETAEGRADVLAQFELLSGFKVWSGYLARLKQVTAEDVRSLAAKYLSAPRLAVHEFQSPQAPPRTFTPEKYAETVGLLVPASQQVEIPAEAATDAKATPVVKQGAPRAVQQEVGKFVVMAQPEPVKDYSTLRGPRAFIRVDPTRPLLAVGLYFQGGRTIEDETNSGITELMLRSMVRGTAKQPGDVLTAELEQLGGEIRVVNELDFFGLELEILSRNGEEGLRRLIDVIENPAFDKEAVKRERDRLLADQGAVANSGPDAAMDLARKSLFGAQPYGLPRLGTGAVTKLTEEDLRKWLEKTVKRQFPLAVVVGDTDGSALVARVLANAVVRNEVDRSIRAKINEAVQKPVEQSGTTARPAAYATWMWALTPGGATGVIEGKVLAEVLEARFQKEIEKSRLGFLGRTRFDPCLQGHLMSVTVIGKPAEEARIRAILGNVLDGLSLQHPTPEEFREAGRRGARKCAQEIETFATRGRNYANSVYLSGAATPVEGRMDEFSRVEEEKVTGLLPAISKEIAGKSLLRGGATP